MDLILNNEVCVDLWQIIAHYGYQHQKEKAIEELGELSRALARDLQYEGDRKNVAEEMADVYVVLAQLQLIYGNRDMIAGFVREKLGRTLETVRKEREE